MSKFKRFVAGALVIPSLGMASLGIASDLKVQNGDSLWQINQKMKIYSINSKNEIVEVSNSIGPKEESPALPPAGKPLPKPDKPNIVQPVIDQTPVPTPTPQPEPVPEVSSKYGEYIEWKDAQKLMPRGTDFKVIDFRTGESFMLRRSVGTNHADVESVTAQDTRMIKKLWGGNFSWARRPVIVEINGRRLAASLAAMPHAGREDQPGGKVVKNRSGDFGEGSNLDYVKGNEMSGVMDLHFFGSVGHANPKPNKEHQDAVKEAAGLLK